MRATETKSPANALSHQVPFFGKDVRNHFFNSKKSQAGHFFSGSGSDLIQPKLTVGQTNDVYEREADAIADQVVQRLATSDLPTKIPVGNHVQASIGTANPGIQTKCMACEQEEKLQKKDEAMSMLSDPIQAKPIFESNGEWPDNVQPIQRKCAECEKEEMLQKKPDQGSHATAPAHIESSLSGSRGGGHPVPPATRVKMENVFGADFSGVRLHTDNTAVQMNKDLGAQAFTQGSDIYFNSGKYDSSRTSGMHLLAHELTHVVQQGKSDTIQRQVSASPAIKEHGDVNQVPADVSRDCNIATAAPASEQKVPYSHNSSRLNSTTKTILNEFTREWHRRGANADVRIDGYASVEGGESLNWRLSCSRALRVKNGLINPSDGSTGIPERFITIHAHGETNRFSQARLAPNRLASITSSVPVNPDPPIPPPTPPVPPTPENKVCGPDVSAETARVWRQVQSDFGGWSFGQKEASCRYLIQPVVPNPGTGRWGLNIDAFDTLGLFLNTAGWTQRPPYHPPCGVPGSLGNPCNNRDPLHEDPNRCSNTVKIGSGCWLTGTANYGTYGVMMKLCYDWVTSPAARLILPFAIQQMLSSAFSYSTMVALISAYKLYDRENPALPVAWSSATYLGGPSSSPSGGNRPGCQTTCSVPFSTPAFDYVWEPAKARSSANLSPYEYPCGTTPP